MDEALKVEMTDTAAAEIQAAIAQMIDEMKQLREQRRQDQAEIERSQAENRSLLSSMTAALAALKAS